MSTKEASFLNGQTESENNEVTVLQGLNASLTSPASPHTYHGDFP